MGIHPRVTMKRCWPCQRDNNLCLWMNSSALRILSHGIDFVSFIVLLIVAILLVPTSFTPCFPSFTLFLVCKLLTVIDFFMWVGCVPYVFLLSNRQVVFVMSWDLLCFVQINQNANFWKLTFGNWNNILTWTFISNLLLEYRYCCFYKQLSQRTIQYYF